MGIRFDSTRIFCTDRTGHFMWEIRPLIDALGCYHTDLLSFYCSICHNNLIQIGFCNDGKVLTCGHREINPTEPIICDRCKIDNCHACSQYYMSDLPCESCPKLNWEFFTEK